MNQELEHLISDSLHNIYMQVLLTHHNTPPSASMAYIAGVCCDVKPAAFGDFSEADLVHFSPQNFRHNLKNLGICVEFENTDYDNQQGLRWYISKDPAKIARLKELESRRSFDDDTVRETGLLLGYPQTATEYFIKRLHMENPPDADLNLDTGYHLDGYIHDPAHLKEECAAYESPIAEYLKQYCPEVPIFN